VGVLGSLLVLAGMASASAGCNSILGNDDHSLAPSAGSALDGSSGTDGSVSLDGSSGSDVGAPGDGSPGVADGNTPSDGAAAPDAGSEAGNDGGCAAGALQCNGNTPQQCVGGLWQDQTTCGGLIPVCSNGVCGTYRTTGGIVSTVASPVAADAGIHLVSGGFELGARSCDEAGMCVTGGLVP
jgi:hypothetical protein